MRLFITFFYRRPVFLVFVADFYKTDVALNMIGKKQIIEESNEVLLVGATDVEIIKFT
ncbi:MAG: hypothetical protein ACRC6K_00255 [Fusobacteriaceae bacterium]